MSATALEVADIFRAYGDIYRQRAGSLPPHHERAIKAILQCRTPALGGHLYACDHCGVLAQRFNSCRNRHCPKCQFLDKVDWLEKRQGEVLPVTYFHLVFTLPDDYLNPLVLRNDQQLYNLLFRAAGETLLQIAADREHLGARIGFIAVLHTWGQKLQRHPHIHCIVPGGGISLSGDRWVASRPDFFLHYKVLSRCFRGKFLAGLEKLVEHEEILFPEDIDPRRARAAYRTWKDDLYSTEWNVYCKPPFGGSEKGLEYLARYTHRIAISNQRLLRLEDDRVHFRYKDYQDDGQVKTTDLEATEFLRRYLQHVLPPRFHRIRYYGLFANRDRGANLERCRVLLGVAAVQDQPDSESGSENAETWQERLQRLTGGDPTLCPVCQIGHLVYLEEIPQQPGLTASAARAPPES